MTLAEVRSEAALERPEGARAADGLSPIPRRLLEVVPPAVAWVVLTSPIWAAIVAPQLLGFFLVAFAAYWLWRSVEFTAGLLLGLRAPARRPASRLAGRWRPSDGVRRVCTTW